MNYLWEIMLKVQDLPEDKVCFSVEKRYSPYLEVALPYLNQETVEELDRIEIGVNPYYRFYNIFKEMYHPETTEFPMLRDSLTNLIFHQLAHNDVMSGMGKEEYYKKLLFKDIQEGRFGNEVKEAIGLFSKKEREVILSGMLRQYETGSSVDIFKDMMEELVPDNIVYRNNENYHEILVYIGQRCNEYIEKKMKLLLNMFVELPYHVDIYYEYHFGIIGIEETMQIDEIALC